MISGSCMCGKVTYQIGEGISDIVHCHCVTCRKAHGSAFSSVASVPDESFLLDGREHLNYYESSPGKRRFFCRHCGTQIYAKRDNKPTIILRLGSIDTDIPVKELAHTWVTEKASWYQIDNNLRHFDKGLK